MDYIFDRKMERVGVLNNHKQRFADKQSLSGELVAFIKEQILEGELSPGDRIVETKLAKDLGISQTPVREAIRQLSGEGIVKIVPNKGSFVRTFSAKDVFEIYSLRASMEGLAFRLATQQATVKDIEELEAFYNKMKEKLHDESVKTLTNDSAYIHQFIYNLSKHSRLIFLYESISFQVSLVNRVLGARYTKLQEVEEHKEIIDALKAGNPTNAEKVMREHIYRSYRWYVKFMEMERKEEENSAWYRELFPK